VTISERLGFGAVGLSLEEEEARFQWTLSMCPLRFGFLTLAPHMGQVSWSDDCSTLLCPNHPAVVSAIYFARGLYWVAGDWLRQTYMRIDVKFLCGISRCICRCQDVAQGGPLGRSYHKR